VDRRDVDDAAEATLVHSRQRRTSQQERGLEHQREDGPEPVRWELVHRRDVLDPGVVDQHVDVESGLGEPVLIGQVDLPRLAADVGSDLGRTVTIEVGDRDEVPFGRQPACAGRADTTGGTGDQRTPPALAHRACTRSRRSASVRSTTRRSS
jgi:hypothetical protein